MHTIYTLKNINSTRKQFQCLKLKCRKMTHLKFHDRNKKILAIYFFLENLTSFYLKYTDPILFALMWMALQIQIARLLSVFLLCIGHVLKSVSDLSHYYLCGSL